MPVLLNDRHRIRGCLFSLLMFVLTSFSHVSAQVDREPVMTAGSAAPALRISPWLKGTPVTSFDIGRVYVIEFWATWCKPCVAAMPQLSAFARKYKDNVSFIGVNVMEGTGSDRVAAFVQKKGADMDYTVGIDDDQYMERHWMQAARQGGLPCTFVIDQQGTIAWIGHPALLDSVLTVVLNRKMDYAQVARTIRRSDGAYYLFMPESEKINTTRERVWKRLQAHEFENALQQCDEMLRSDAETASGLTDLYYLAMLRIFPDSAYKKMEQLVTDNERWKLVLMWRVAQEDNLQAKCYTLARDVLETVVGTREFRGQEMIVEGLAEAYFHSGEVDKAIDIETNWIDKMQKAGGDDRYLAPYRARLEKFKQKKKIGRHVVLISIDGFRPDMYLDPSWPCPNLQMLKQTGTCAKRMISVFPSFIYPSHAAMLTGALPPRSGICYNAKRGSEQWYWFTRDIKVPTLWQALEQKGLTSAAIEWPVSVGVEITWNVPEIWSTDDPEDRITETRKYATKGLIEELEANATGKLSGENMNEEYLSLDENSGRMAAYMFKQYQPSLLAVHFAGVDGAQHEQGRNGLKVKLALAAADRAIGNIIEAIERSGLKAQTTMLIVGDHGFSNSRQVLRPNAWLKQHNINARFQAAGGSAFLYAEDENEVSEVKKILQQLPVSYTRLFKIYSRTQLDKMGADSSARLAFAAVPGIVFSGSDEGEQLTPASGGHHGYDPNLPDMYTGFIAAGAGVSKGKVIDMLNVTDIAPLIAALLKLEFKTPDGRLVEGVLQEKK